MSTRARSTPDAPPAAPAGRVGRGDAIDQWLAMFVRFLRVSAERRRAIRDELDSHVRERVRDLMLAGLNEDEGVRRAIDELGEAAELAAHFNAAHRPGRRTLMSIASLGVAATAAVISIVALNHGQPADPPVQPPTPAVGSAPAEGVPVLKDVPLLGQLYVPAPAANGIDRVRINAKLDQPSIRSLSTLLAQSCGKRLSLIAGDIDVDMTLSPVELVDADVRALLREMSERAELVGERRMGCRVRGDVIEVAPAAVLDRAETALVAYDISDVFSAQATRDDLRETITQFVEPEGWRDNGGTTAQLRFVGNRLFVQAPPRYQAGVSWILEQFTKTPRARSPKAGSAPAAASGRAGQAQTAAERDLNLNRAAFLRREIAWTKVRLGEKLTGDELAVLDERSVHAAETADEVAEARAQLIALEQELAGLTSENGAPRAAEAAAQIKATPR